MHYYQFNIGDYASHTRHLSPIEDIAYRRLLDNYYLSERPFNSNVTTVARQIGLREYEKEVEQVLNEFFELIDDGWVHHRAEKEISNYKSKIDNASKAGKASAEKRFNARSTDVQLTNNHKPLTNNHNKEIQAPFGVSDDVWESFLKQRKLSRATVSETVIKSIQKEADKAGWTLEQALSEIVARGWRGFKADWVKDKSLTSAAEKKKEFISGLTRGLLGGDKNVKLINN